MKRYPLLQSGFVSGAVEHLTKPVTTQQSISSAILLKPYLHPGSDHYYSEAVRNLYVAYMTDHEKMRNFHFREQILKNAATLFGTPSLLDWVRIQILNGEIGPMHAKFLLDTMRFIVTGERHLEVSQWARMIDATPASNSPKIDLQTFFSVRDGDKNIQVPTQWPAVISDWVSHPTGFTDLLVTLYVIFGDRSNVNYVSN